MGDRERERDGYPIGENEAEVARMIEGEKTRGRR